IRNEETGAVTRIENLSVTFDDGEAATYDVDFLSGSAVDVYGEDLLFDFVDLDAAEAATQGVINALGRDMEFLGYNGGERTDRFMVGWKQLINPWSNISVTKITQDHDETLSGDTMKNGHSIKSSTDDGTRWAKFTIASASGGGNDVSTPEPSLIFGFITLGGLMLGSNARKNKG
ncbi:MAG: PEP-CTERM sorting domain-containing protein, partial [Crocosphaera sp.]